jgi:hypothetical protein
VERFIRTGSARLTKLFRDADLRADAIHRVQTIYRKARELSEERGIRAAYLATGWPGGTSCSSSRPRRCCCAA